MSQSDAELVRRFLERGDEAAFRGIVERHAAAVLRAAHAVTRDLQAAEDATQETFLAASRELARFDAARSLRAWLSGIAVKRASKLVRTRSRFLRREKEVAMAPRPQPTPPGDEAQRRETRALLEQTLDELPPAQRAPLLLHYGEGLSQREVAEVMGVAHGTVKSRIGRALVALRDKLGRRGASLAVADLPHLLSSLPGPSPSPGLIEACASHAAGAAAAGATGAYSASSASGASGGVTTLLAGKKLIAVALLVSAGTIVTVASIRGDSPVPRGTRAEQAADLPAGGAAAEGDALYAPPPSARADASAAPEITQPVAAGGAARRAGVGAARAARPGIVVVNGKEFPIDQLPDGIRILPGGAAGGGAGPVVAGPAGAAGAGRFSPRRVPGKFSRWAPAPRFRGEATLSGRVVDANGKPVKGADVYRMAAGVDRTSSTVVSFEHLAKIAVTGEDGTFRAERQEHGAFLVVANFQRLLNRPKGMETKDAVAVRVEQGAETGGIELAVPASVAELVPFGGIVRDEEGRPVAGAEVFVDYLRLRTGADGRFDAGLVPAGERQVIVRKTGYELIETPVPVARGQENLAELTLVLAEKGEMRLAGLLLDDAGNPVAGATIYLNAGRGTVRAVKSGADGSYRFENLPDRLAHEACTINVYAKGHFPKYVAEVPMPADPFEIRVERAIPVAIKVVSAVTGEPLQQIVGKLQIERVENGEVVRITRRSWSVYKEDGVLDDLACPPGKVFIELEAPGHQLTVVELDLAVEEGRRELTIPLNPTE